jgi:hypothetical protein
VYSPLDVVKDPLYVISVIFNPVRFKSRWKLYRDFQRHIRESGAILVTVECAFGDREFALEEHARSAPLVHSGEHKSFGPAHVPPAALMPHQRPAQEYIKIRADYRQELWLKENMANLALQHLPESAKYVAFIDADVMFVRPDWVSETIQQLQHYAVVQMFSTAVDLTPQHDPMQMYRSFGHSYVNNVASDTATAYYAGSGTGGLYYWHPGFAWAWRKDALDKVGGLYDQGMLGAGDHHMAWAMIGQYEKTFPGNASAGYLRSVKKWQDEAAQLHRNVGFVGGTLLHFWHGKKSDRKYNTRWDVLTGANFDPYTDLKKDWRGVYAIQESNIALRDGVRAYFRARSEDSIDMNPYENHLVGEAKKV